MWTAKNIENFRPSKGKRTRLMCPSKSGLGLIISPLGKKTYFFRYTFAGRRREINIGNADHMPLKDAREKIKTMKTKMSAGLDPAVGHADTKTGERVIISEAFELWLKSEVAVRVKSLHTIQSYRSVFKVHFLPYFGNDRLQAITESALNHRIAEMIGEGQHINSTKLVPRLKDFFKWCKKTYSLDTNPAIELETPAKRKARDRNLSVEELKIFLDGIREAPEIYALPLEFLIFSGQRKMEVIGMPVGEVRFSEGLWVIDKARVKSTRDHSLPLTERLASIIEHSIALSHKRGIENPQYVFTGAEGGRMGTYTINYYVKETCKYFGLEEFTIHDLRRTAATQMAAAKVILEHRERVLNHVQGGEDKVYNIYDYLEEKSQALHALDERLTSIETGSVEAPQVMSWRAKKQVQ